MARITVEDCVRKIDRFSLVIVASQRVRDMEGGSPLLVPRENDKSPVVALREMAAGLLDVDKLLTSFMLTFQKHRSNEEWSEKGLDEDPCLDEDPVFSEDEFANPDHASLADAPSEHPSPDSTPDDDENDTEDDHPLEDHPLEDETD